MKPVLVLVLLTGPFLPAFAADDKQVAESVFVRNSEIYVTRPGSSEAQQLTHDGLPKSQPVLSKDGTRFAYIRTVRTSALAELVVMRADGRTLREIHFRPAEANVSGMRYVEGLQWISERRLAVSGSVNPSTAEYVVVDVETGKEIGGYLVDGFAWAASPDGSHAAYVGYVPHFTPEERRRPQFCLDDECGFDKPFRGYSGPAPHLEFAGAPVWSPDGVMVALVAENYETKARTIVVRRVGGKPSEASEFAAPAGAEGDLRVSWEGRTLVVRSQDGAWRLEPGAKAFIRSRP